jgi:hypothetical protein
MDAVDAPPERLEAPFDIAGALTAIRRMTLTGQASDVGGFARH